jgi:diguanylate cyclase (GGDEF)-like protein
MHDPLCGLPNRIFFGERLEAVIEEVRNGSAPAAVFYIDLDHFKDVNDTLGHHVGDELIRNVTLRLSHTLRGNDLVARLGGDEFAVISSIAGDNEKMTTLAQRIISQFALPTRSAGRTSSSGHRSASRSSMRTAGPQPTSCATPTWRSIAPRTRDATAPASTTRRWMPTSPHANCSRRIYAKRSTPTSCSCCISRSSTRAAILSSAWRRCAAGNIRPAARSRRPNSSRLPSTAD